MKHEMGIFCIKMFRSRLSIYYHYLCYCCCYYHYCYYYDGGEPQGGSGPIVCQAPSPTAVSFYDRITENAPSTVRSSLPSLYNRNALYGYLRLISIFHELFTISISKLCILSNQAELILII